MALAIDGSTPAAVTSSTAAATTASFTPPAGAVLLVLFSANTGSGNTPTTPTITDSLGAHLTYSLVDHSRKPDTPSADGQAASWTAPVASSAAMTVTVTSTDPATGVALKVFVLTGADTVTPVGAHGKAGSISAASVAQAYTAQATGGQGFIAIVDWDAKGTETAGSGTTVGSGDSGSVSTQISYGFARRTSADDSNGVSNTVTVNIPTTSTNLRWVYVEIVPSAGAAAPGPVGFMPPFDFTPGLDGPTRLAQFQPDPRAVQAITRLTQDFNQGADGTAITAGNSAGAGESPFDSVVAAPGDGFNEYDSAQFHDGPLAGLIQTTTTSGNPSWTWSTSMGTQTQVWGRFYLRIGAYPAAKNRIINFMSGATQCASIVLDTTGLLGIRNNASTDVMLTTVIPLNTWVRVEFRYQFGTATGNANLRLYSTNADANVPNFDDSASTSAANFGAASADTFTFGQFAASATRGPFWFDSIELNNIDYPGPVAIYPVSNPDVSVNADFADSAGVANDASVEADVNSGDAGASTTGTANDAGPSVQANAECATATGVANDSRIDLIAYPPEAQSSGAAAAPVANVAPNADVGTATGTANDVTRIDIIAYPSEAQATAAAQQPAVSIAVPADVAASTGTAGDATPNVMPSAGSGDATGTANNADHIEIVVYPSEAQATGTANDAAPNVAVNADVATATGTANDATVSAASSVSANAECATATGTANDARVDLSVYPSEGQASGTANDAVASISVPAGSAAATGTANDATVSTVSNTSAPADVATATGTANDAVASIAANADVAAASGTSQDASVSLAANADVALATGTANSPTASLAASADVASASAAANDASVSVTVYAECATATGTANDATVSAASSVNANAECATATGAANDATVNLGASADVSSGTGVANDASASLLVYADFATGTGTANDVTASTVSNTNASAGVATATGVAGDAVASVGASPAEAQAAGTVNDGSVTISVQAGNAPATGIVDNPVGGPTTSALAGVALAVASAFDVPVLISAGSLDAQGIGEAYDASVDAVVTPTGGELDASFVPSVIVDGSQIGSGGIEGPAARQSGAESATGGAGATEGAMVAAGQQG